MAEDPCLALFRAVEGYAEASRHLAACKEVSPKTVPSLRKALAAFALLEGPAQKNMGVDALAQSLRDVRGNAERAVAAANAGDAGAETLRFVLQSDLSGLATCFAGPSCAAQYALVRATLEDLDAFN